MNYCTVVAPTDGKVDAKSMAFGSLGATFHVTCDKGFVFAKQRAVEAAVSCGLGDDIKGIVSWDRFGECKRYTFL